MANKNWFSILDIVGAVNEQEDHEKNRNYWKYLKAKLKKENSEVVSATTQLKLTASDGKKYKTDVISQAGVEQLAKSIRNQRAMVFLDWFKYSENTIDGRSKKKAHPARCVYHEWEKIRGEVMFPLRKFLWEKFGSLGKSPYICTRKRARTGGASVIRASSIAFGLHRPCRKKQKRHIYECSINEQPLDLPPRSFAYGQQS